MKLYRCTNGHESPIEFNKDEISFACPNCGLTIWKFRDYVKSENTKIVGPISIEVNNNKSWSKKNILLYLSIAAAGLAVAVYSNTKANVGSAIKTDSVLPISQTSIKHSFRDIANIEIKDFAALNKGGDIIDINFLLQSKDETAVDYPDLILTWKESAADKVILTPKDYTTDPGKLVKTAVNVEISKPVDATGIDITIGY